MSPNHSPHRDRSVLEAFGVLTALDAVENAHPDSGADPVLINDVLAYVQGRTTPATSRVKEALGENLSVRRQYQQLLRLDRIEHIARPAAAHTQAFFEKRVGEQGVQLKLKQSRAKAGQYYLIIELPEAVAVPEGRELVLHANTQRQSERAVFPPLHDGRTQVILGEESPLLRLLQDHDVEIDLH